MLAPCPTRCQVNHTLGLLAFLGGPETWKRELWEMYCPHRKLEWICLYLTEHEMAMTWGEWSNLLRSVLSYLWSGARCSHRSQVWTLQLQLRKQKGRRGENHGVIRAAMTS